MVSHIYWTRNAHIANAVISRWLRWTEYTAVLERHEINILFYKKSIQKCGHSGDWEEDWGINMDSGCEDERWM